MPAIHDATGAPVEGRALYRSAELRFAVAVIVAGCALLLALLVVAEKRTDLLLLDFRDWRPVNEAAHFQYLQADPPDRRPFRLVLQLDEAAGGAPFMAAEREIPAAEGETYCFDVLVSPEEAVWTDDYRIAVAVNGAVAWAAPLKSPGSPGRGYAIALSGLRGRQGKIRIRLELRRSVPVPPPGPSPAVQFEYASLRECDGQGGR